LGKGGWKTHAQQTSDDQFEISVPAGIRNGERDPVLSDPTPFFPIVPHTDNRLYAIWFFEHPLV